MTRIAAVIATTLLLAACTTQSGPQRYTGVYALAFEMQAFTADGSGESWWATMEPKAQAELNAALPPNQGPPAEEVPAQPAPVINGPVMDNDKRRPQ